MKRVHDDLCSAVQTFIAQGLPWHCAKRCLLDIGVSGCYGQYRTVLECTWHPATCAKNPTNDCAKVITHDKVIINCERSQKLELEI